MANLTPDAVEHALPFLELGVVAAVGLVSMAVAFWRGFKWLDERIEDKTLLNGWQALNEARHQEHSRAISELREGIKRVHRRIDDIEKGQMP